MNTPGSEDEGYLGGQGERQGAPGDKQVAPRDGEQAAPILVVVDSASQIDPALRVARYLAREGASQVHLTMVVQGSVPTPRQLEPYLDQVTRSTVMPQADIVTQEGFFDYAVVVAFLTGSRLLGLRHAVELATEGRGVRRRPILITGYNGVVYEKHQEGLMWRIGYDLICVNSPRDQANFRTLCARAGCSDEALVMTGLPLAQSSAGGLGLRVSAFDGGLLFATQAVVPRKRAERVYVLERLAEYARRHPDRRVIIKGRARPGERTFHVERHPYETLWQETGLAEAAPPNLEFAYEPLHTYLPHVSFVLSVSSTAVLESIAAGTPAFIVRDFGPMESLGTQFFSGSGLEVSFDELLEDRLPEPSHAWLRDNGVDAPEGIGALAAAVARLGGRGNQ